VCFFSKTVYSQDIYPPDTPVLDSVSLENLTTGSVYVSWFPCDSPDVASYVIFRQIATLWDPIDTIPAPATLYIDNSYIPAAAANAHPELYRIAAIDFAGNISAMTPPALYHNTMYLFPYLDSINCQTAIKLRWNKYINWSEGVKYYTIFVNVNSTSWDSLTTVDGNTNEYFHQNLTDNTHYCYFVRAVSYNGRTSTSNQNCFFVNLPNYPSFINADYATVNSNNQIEVSFTLDTSSIVKKNYILYRAENYSGPFVTLNSYNNYTNLKLVYIDNVDVTKQWCYKLAAIDQCNNIVKESNNAQNINIYVSSADDLTEFISWNRYLNWLGGVDSYNIYRIVDNNAPVLINTNYSDTVFIDDISDYATNRTGASGNFCYYVEATETSLNPYGIIGTSKSNTVCATQPPIVYMPNVFTPNENNVNDFFMPIASFVNPDYYYFRIFDRWGNKIFETNNPTKGWDGKIKGHKVPTGTYVYTLKYNESENKSSELSGFFYLFYP